MGIKNLNYSGGTLTKGVGVKGSVVHQSVEVPVSMNELISLLETRIGDSVTTIAFQIHPTQHLSEERIIINYVVDPETFQNTKTIINVSDMDTDETNKYNEIKSDLGI